MAVKCSSLALWYLMHWSLPSVISQWDTQVAFSPGSWPLLCGLMIELLSFCDSEATLKETLARGEVIAGNMVNVL